MSTTTIVQMLSPKRLLRGRFVSKWVVLIIDLMMISFSLSVAFTLQSKLDLYHLSILTFYKGLITVLVFSIIGHLIFKPHEGIIRHTGIYDIKVLFYARSVSFILNLLFIFLLSDKTHLGSYAIPFKVATINYFLSLYLLIQFRLGIRFIFNQGKKAKTKPKIFIYGSGESGRLTYDAMSPYFDVVSFIDDNSSMSGKYLKGVKIIHSENNIEGLIEKYQIKHLIISIQNISAAKKRLIIDKCLQYDVEVKVVPPVEKWLNGELTTSQIKSVKIEELLGRDVITLDKSLLESEINNKTILITGAAGSIGSELVRQLVKFNPQKLLLLDQAESPLHSLDLELEKLIKDKNIIIQTLLIDIKDYNSLRNVFETYNIEWIFHAAAYKHVPAMELNPIQAVKVNILGTKILADLANEFKVKKMVFVSTDKAVNPTNVMGASKRAAEMYVQSKSQVSNTAYITTRFGNVLGSNGSVIPLFKKQIEDGGPITVTDPEVTRYFMTIPEACQLVLDACVMGKGGEIFVFDMGESVKIVDLAAKMIKLSGLIPDRDIQIKFTGLRPGEKLYEELLNNKESILPTHHDKIMIAKVIEYKLDEVEASIHELEEVIASKPDNSRTVAFLKRIVPEFKSKNSPYEQLDIGIHESFLVK